MFYVPISFPSGLISSGSLIFNGTLITLNAVYRPPPFDFLVHIDSLTFRLSHFAGVNLLYQSDPLDPNKEHTVSVEPASILESVTVEMDLGDKADVMIGLDDGQLFEQDGFVATGSWNTDACLGTGRAAGTCYVSEGSGSIISYTFEGLYLNAISQRKGGPLTKVDLCQQAMR
ncbi:hypothetical protein M407DRAFT_20251 [Tulasnella calospora MUT 4182]|uniref:Uncharacterized protein n=1 Tax=Tulasnella calospora MUT 4182 TaxID=1051891 RepID=A0A0C3QQE6_9AGAM|nr:hypothetical protein M407DRAFT_20251 [Tulasnella calospora MUT 4182]